MFVPMFVPTFDPVCAYLAHIGYRWLAHIWRISAKNMKKAPTGVDNEATPQEW